MDRLSSAEAKEDADEVKGEFMAGKFVIFKGPLKDNTRKGSDSGGHELSVGRSELDKMDYFVDGVKAEK